MNNYIYIKNYIYVLKFIYLYSDFEAKWYFKKVKMAMFLHSLHMKHLFSEECLLG